MYLYGASGHGKVIKDILELLFFEYELSYCSIL